ncbi:MAG: tannase/feruloyl esterase family alpha/beta hydrolase, partial [Sphingomonas bacterium]
YGKPVTHSYMTGCSTGGREGMLASQRYPELFDGIIVGAPAMRTGDSNLALEYTTVLFNQSAPKGKDGKPVLTQLISAADRKTILDGLLAQCDALDGLKDGMIEAVSQCRFDPKRLQCKRGKQDGCLIAGQVNAMIEGFKGPRDKAGYAIYAPVPYDTGIVSTPIGYLPTGAPGPFGPPTQATSIDLDARIHALRDNAEQRLTDTNYWTNLSTYLGRGGKMIFYHGVSDFWFSAFATWDYYERDAKENGAAFTDASRFYMVPGMLHCGGGNSFDQFDMLTPLVEWVEKGEAPEAITAGRRAPDPAERPLCPYPGYAVYKGGDEKLARSFACKAGS